MWKQFHYQNKSLKNRRRQLRSKPTETEIILWDKLRNSQLGAKFIRQYSVDGYVVDFYSPSCRLAIEIDGPIHLKSKIYDNYRDRYLHSHDICVMHFLTTEVKSNLNIVLKKILQNIPSYP